MLDHTKNNAMRAVYTAPCLVTYGAVRELTCAGSGTLTEGKMMTSKKRKA